jgi:hypothetical protein
MKIKQLITLLLLLALLGLAYFYFTTNRQAKRPQILPTNFKLGVVNNCRKVPNFVQSLNMQQPAIDSKQQGHNGGLLIRDIRNRNHAWQHKSWEQSGFIGAFDRDNKGNIYVAPLPYVSLLKNPPEKQNQIYLIDHKSAQMSLYLKLPSEFEPNSKNPFGSMGIFYDCETHSLYVSSVAGSLPKQEKGVIYQIDLNTNKIISSLKNTDAVGIGIFNTLKSKRLYFGSARKPYIYSIKLDQNGSFTGPKRYELSLSQIQGGDTTVAKKFVFKKVQNKYQMTIKETEFGFRLMAENNLNRKKYHFQYSISADKWKFLQATHD